MAYSKTVILDEHGGTIDGMLNFQKVDDNGYGYVHKNHGVDADYGMQIRDYDASSNSAVLQISAKEQQAYLILQPAGQTSNKCALYGPHNIPPLETLGAYSSSGGIIGGVVTIKKTPNNGYGEINKNHSSTLDYGMQIRDFDKDNKEAALIVSGTNQKASLYLKETPTGTSHMYDIYHAGNKPSNIDLIYKDGYCALSNDYTASYFKTQDGVVTVSFTVKKTEGSLDAKTHQFASLPDGYRPEKNVYFAVVGNGSQVGDAYGVVLSTGTISVVVKEVGNQGYVGQVSFIAKD